jgi:hypothetical protein
MEAHIKSLLEADPIYIMDVLYDVYKEHFEEHNRKVDQSKYYITWYGDNNSFFADGKKISREEMERKTLFKKEELYLDNRDTKWIMLELKEYSQFGNTVVALETETSGLSGRCKFESTFSNIPIHKLKTHLRNRKLNNLI